MPQIKINNTNIKDIKLPAGGQNFYWDTELKGFGVKATPEFLVYVAQRRIGGRGGKTIRHILGRHGEITPTQARTKAASALSDLRVGVDLNVEKKQKKKEHVLGGITLASAYADFKASRTLRPRTIQTYDENIERTLPDWLPLPLTAITAEMVQKRHKDLSTAGKNGRGLASANQTMRLLRVIFNYAIIAYDNGKGQPLLTENPTKRLSLLGAWNKVEPRDTIVQPQSLKAWFKAVMLLENATLRDYFLFLIFSGLRRTETMCLQWSYVDKKARILTVPAEIAKTGKTRQIPITAELGSILNSRWNDRVEDNPFIFARKNSLEHIIEPKRAVNFVREKSSVRWSPHDLRRTYGTIASRLDVSHYKLKQLLGHSVTGDVTGNHYIQVDVETLREPANRIAKYLKEKMGIKTLRGL